MPYRPTIPPSIHTCTHTCAAVYDQLDRSRSTSTIAVAARSLFADFSSKAGTCIRTDTALSIAGSGTADAVVVDAVDTNYIIIGRAQRTAAAWGGWDRVIGNGAEARFPNTWAFGAGDTARKRTTDGRKRHFGGQIPASMSESSSTS